MAYFGKPRQVFAFPAMCTYHGCVDLRRCDGTEACPVDLLPFSPVHPSQGVVHHLATTALMLCTKQDACQRMCLTHTAIHVGCNTAAALDHAKRHALQQLLHVDNFFDTRVTYCGGQHVTYCGGQQRMCQPIRPQCVMCQNDLNAISCEYTGSLDK